MKCPKCQFENREGAKFCKECGNKLELICPQCGAAYTPGTKFCDECGQSLTEAKETPPVDYSQPRSYTPKFLADKILTTRSSIEGERKLVTVLFADVANYTSMSEKLDPEEVHEIMDGCFQILMDVIHGYEGTINQFTGDGVMALFGAPLAHEDHARRACHAALSIQSAVRAYGEKIEKKHGSGFKLRIGLNSGPVIVGSIGDDLRMDYTAVGDTTNLAARMESLAKPGSIAGTAHTYKLARDFFRFDSLGKVEVKGKEEPVEAYVLLEPTTVETRIEASAAKGLTKLVGRGREMETLKQAYEKARSGSGQVLGIVGEAGVGKSRLLVELRNMLYKKACTYLEGQCLHYGGSMTYLPLIDILKSYFAIKEGDREFIIKKKIAEKIFNLDERLKGTLPPFQEMLSLKVEDAAYLQLEPSAKKLRAFEAIRDLLVRESQNKPVVLAIEDLHWIDKSSEDFLNYLIDWLAGTHILLILLYRPEYTHTWGSKSYYSKVGVDQLSTKSSIQLVQNILERGEVLPELGELILNRAGGNPLFVEELTHSLIENGSIQKKDHQYVITKEPSEIEVPDTIQGIIAARIDRIEENLKWIMQVASVIGREFAYRILQAIMGMREELKSSLINLQGLEFIYEKRLFPELEYIFKHALTQEVAYNSLLQKRRREIHEKIGNAIEALYADRLEEYYDLLAYHYVRSDNKEKAVSYLDLANQKAAKLNAMEAAKSYFDQAMNLLDALPDTDGKSRRRISLVVNQWLVFILLFQVHDYYNLLTRYQDMAAEVGDQDLLGRFFVAMGSCQWWLGAYDQAIETLGKAAGLFEASGAFEYAGQAYVFLQWSHLCKGNFEHVFILKKRALLTTEKQFNLLVYVYAFDTAAWACTCLNRWDGAIENGKEALKKAEEYADKSLISFTANVICQAYCFKGELDRAIEYGELAIQKAPTPGDKLWAEGFLAMAWIRTGKLQQGIATLSKIADAHDKGRFVFGQVGYTLMLGLGYFLAGEYEKAIQPLKGGLELAERSDMKWFIGLAHVFLGQVALQTNPTQAVYHFEQSIARYQQIQGDPIFIDFLRGVTLLTKGNLTKGMKVLEAVSEAFLKNGSIWYCIETEYILSNIYVQIVLREGPKSLPFFAKNIGFLMESVPRASEKAAYHLQKVIDTAQNIGANPMLAQASLDLGLLHKAKGRTEQARECITKSIQIFEQCEAEVFLNQAKEALVISK
jgi:class 3 adenylate cyclase/tetratricopeptide (TPR) repeat protein